MGLYRFGLDVLDVFWELGEGSLRQVQDALSDRSPAYTTVQTIVLRLEVKGAVKRKGKSGNAFVFAPAVTKKSQIRRLLDELLDLVGGSPQLLVAQLLESGKLTLDDLKALEITASKSSGKKKKERRK